MNIEKTTIQNITAKITTTALLFFLALFTFHWGYCFLYVHGSLADLGDYCPNIF